MKDSLDAPGGAYFWDEATVQVETRPLIETTFEVRKRMYGRLPDLIRACCNELSIEPIRRRPATPPDDDIPF